MKPASDETLSDSRGGSKLRGVPHVPHLFLVLEAERPRSGSARCSLAGVAEVTLSRAAERTIARSDGALAVGVQDRRMSNAHASLRASGDSFLLLDQGSTNGTWVNGQRVEQKLLVDGDVIEVGRTFFRFRAAEPTPEGTPLDASSEDLAETSRGLRTLLPAFGAELSKIAPVARSRVPVVLSGPSGTGKELVARAVHALSSRPGAFVAVNCGAMPEGLVESHLFGHVRGAFSGAVRDEIGLVRSADQGTLFLDEIADLAPSSQAALLRMLQESEVTPVGATRPIRVDLRVLCATHADLDALAVRGEFRLDLLARLAGMRVALPPLAERLDELGLLIAELLASAPSPAAVSFAPEAVHALLRHRWPMNVRELAQCLGVASALAGDGAVALAHLPASVTTPRRAEPLRVERDDDRLRDTLVEALAKHGGNVSAVARELGKARMQVQRWMKRFQLEGAPSKKH